MLNGIMTRLHVPNLYICMCKLDINIKAAVVSSLIFTGKKEKEIHIILLLLGLWILEPGQPTS